LINFAHFPIVCHPLFYSAYILFGKIREKEKENSVVGLMFLPKRIKVLPKEFSHFISYRAYGLALNCCWIPPPRPPPRLLSLRPLSSFDDDADAVVGSVVVVAVVAVPSCCCCSSCRPASIGRSAGQIDAICSVAIPVVAVEVAVAAAVVVVVVVAVVIVIVVVVVMVVAVVAAFVAVVLVVDWMELSQSGLPYSAVPDAFPGAI
jgi:hypothetical protein